MNRIQNSVMILSAAALLLAPGDASARVPIGDLQVSPVVGFAVPLSYLRDEARAGYTTGVALHYMVSDREGFGIELDLTRFKSTSHLVTTYWEEPGYITLWHYARQLVHYGGTGRFYLTDPQSPNPFLEAGIGATTAIFRESTDTWGHERAVTNIGYRLGLGFDLMISHNASGLITITWHGFNDPNGGKDLHYWTARFTMAFQFRPI